MIECEKETLPANFCAERFAINFPLYLSFIEFVAFTWNLRRIERKSNGPPQGVGLIDRLPQWLWHA